MLPSVRAGVVLLIGLLLAVAPAAIAPAATSGTASYWSVAKLLRRLDGDRIRVGARTVRLNRETTLCAGRGASIRRDGMRRWRRFMCTYTTFTSSGLDRDVDFRVVVRSRTRYSVYDAHWVRAAR
jgi:hypothetical protein